MGNQINIADFDSEQAAFNTCKANKGSTLFIPVGEFNVDSLTLPHYTNVEGAHQKLSILNGSLNVPCNQGGIFNNVSVESIHSDRLRDWKFDQVRFFGDIAISLTGSSYYNLFNMPRIESRIGFIFKGFANNNWIKAGRSNCSEYHVKCEADDKGYVPNGLYIQSTFEGTRDGDIGTGAGVVHLMGKDHTLNACWHERAKDNKYSPAAIDLDKTVEGLLILGGRRSYLYSINGHPSQYIIIPQLKMPTEYF